MYSIHLFATHIKEKYICTIRTKELTGIQKMVHGRAKDEAYDIIDPLFTVVIKDIDITLKL